MTQAIEIYDDTRALTLTGDPEAALENAARAAKALVHMVDQTKSFALINGRKYLRFEAWQTVGMFYGVTARIAIGGVIPRFNIEGLCLGYDAVAEVVRHGEVIGGASSFCLFAEENWGGRAEFQVASMAQTRAMSKALRSVLAFVAVLAGYEATPAEEMISIEHTSPRTHPEPQRGSPAPPSSAPDSSAATAAQVQAIYTIGHKVHNMEDAAIEKLCSTLYGVVPQGLTKRQASLLIDKLKQP